jgi:hypothetical protein
MGDTKEMISGTLKLDSDGEWVLYTFGETRLLSEGDVVGDNRPIPLDLRENNFQKNHNLYENYMVTIQGRMGIPSSTPQQRKFIVEKIIGFNAITNRAYEISISGTGGSEVENWLRAEKELLDL